MGSSRVDLDIKKEVMRHKEILEVGGQVIDVSHIPTCSSIVKTINIHLLFLASKANNLKAANGDIRNACINASTSEKVHSRSGP